MSSSSPQKIIEATMRLVETTESSHISLNANGGNSVLVICEPLKEIEYIEAMKALMLPSKYDIIELEKLLNQFVMENREDIELGFELLKGSIHQIFKAPQGEEGPDFLGLILKAISESIQIGKIPVLINAGSLYGSGISNIHIMENELIMKAPLPLIILYPAIKVQEKLMYLGKRPASKYRCMIVD